MICRQYFLENWMLYQTLVPLQPYLLVHLECTFRCSFCVRCYCFGYASISCACLYSVFWQPCHRFIIRWYPWWQCWRHQIARVQEKTTISVQETVLNEEFVCVPRQIMPWCDGLFACDVEKIVWGWRLSNDCHDHGEIALNRFETFTTLSSSTFLSEKVR